MKLLELWIVYFCHLNVLCSFLPLENLLLMHFCFYLSRPNSDVVILMKVIYDMRDMSLGLISTLSVPLFDDIVH